MPSSESVSVSMAVSGALWMRASQVSQRGSAQHCFVGLLDGVGEGVDAALTPPAAAGASADPPGAADAARSPSSAVLQLALARS